MKINMKWGNSARKIEKAIEESVDTVEKDTPDNVKRTGMEIKRNAESNTPVETGNLKRGWKVDTKSRNGRVSESIVENDVEYASYVENGTSRTAPRRMLTRAIMRSDTRMQRRLDKMGRSMERKFNRS